MIILGHLQTDIITWLLPFIYLREMQNQKYNNNFYLYILFHNLMVWIHHGNCIVSIYNRISWNKW